MPILLLFDIDGTLIRGSRAARMAFAAAVQACLGAAIDTSTLESAGKTDFRIMQEILDGQGLDDATIEEDLLACYVQQLVDAVGVDPGQVCPGVRPLLHRLAAAEGIVLALGTGNLERCARIKLAAHDLGGYFQTGGFGEDGLERNAIIAAGISKAKARYQTRFRHVVVIGDTPYDIAGARANGVQSLGVATGPYDVEALRQAGATVAIPDLTQAESVIAALTSFPPSTPFS